MPCPYCTMLMRRYDTGVYDLTTGAFTPQVGYRCVNRGCSLHDELMTAEQIKTPEYLHLVAKIKNTKRR